MMFISRGTVSDLRDKGEVVSAARDTPLAGFALVSTGMQEAVGPRALATSNVIVLRVSFYA